MSPERTAAQRSEALGMANHIRSTRARFKRDLRTGVIDVHAVLQQLAWPAPDMDTMRVVDLVQATPKIGHHKTAALLRRAGIAPSKTLGALTTRQRDTLIREVRAAHPVLRLETQVDNAEWLREDRAA